MAYQRVCIKSWIVICSICSILLESPSIHGASLPLSKLSETDGRKNSCAPDDDFCNEIFSVKQDALDLVGKIFDNFPDLAENEEDTAELDGGDIQKLPLPEKETNQTGTTQEPSELSESSKITTKAQIEDISTVTETDGNSAVSKKSPDDDLIEKPDILIEDDILDEVTTTLPDIEIDWETVAEYHEVTTVLYDDVISDADASSTQSRESAAGGSGAEVIDGSQGNILSVTSQVERDEAEGAILVTDIVADEFVTEHVTEVVVVVDEEVEEEGELAGQVITSKTPTTAAQATTEEATTATGPTTTETGTTTTVPTTTVTTQEPPTTLPPLPRDCDDIWRQGHRESAIYRIYPAKSYGFDVFCDLHDAVGGWTVIQRRVNGTVNFYQSYFDYMMGFGDLHREFYLGNERIYQLTNQNNYELAINLFDFERESRYARYSLFRIGDYGSDYELTVRGYIGNAGDSLGYHSEGRFSTFDRDNDDNPAMNCARDYDSGWWFKNCDVSSNLNGRYLRGGNENRAGGITWRKWKGSGYSLKFAEMKIRPLKL